MTIPTGSVAEWAAHLLGSDELPGLGNVPLSVTVRELIDQQLATWPMLAEAVAGLSQVELRGFTVRETRTLVQFNPRRITSTSARVDAATISRRACFLCPTNLPAEEKGIPFGDRYVILCNPYPVLPDHLVISARDHVPQSIATTVTDLFDLAAELGADWFALYNGPRCGASAPDHLHFQAGSVAAIPIFNELNGEEAGLDQRLPAPAVVGRGVRATILPRLSQGVDYRLNLLLLESDDREALAAVFDRALALLAALTESEGQEPLVNLVIRYDEGCWRLVVIPRGRHRPSCFFAEGESQLMVSPAAIDLGGLFVVPNRRDFERISGEDLEVICREVQLDDRLFSAWWEGLTTVDFSQES